MSRLIKQFFNIKAASGLLSLIALSMPSVAMADEGRIRPGC